MTRLCAGSDRSRIFFELDQLYKQSSVRRRPSASRSWKPTGTRELA